jgi:predicted MFS family arabinose efflux permease
VGTYWVLLNLYFRELGLAEGQIGRILSFQALGTVLMAVPASMLAVRFRLKWLLALAAVTTVTACVLIVTLRPVGLLMLAACLTGAGFIIHHVVAAPFFMRNSTTRERLHLFGVNYALEILASVAGVAGGGWLAARLGDTLGSPLLGLRYTLLLAAGLLSLALVPYLLIQSPPPPQGRTHGFRVWRVQRPRLLVKLLAPTFFLGCGAGLIIPFLNLYFRDRFGLESWSIGRIFAVSQGLTAAGFMLGPVLARRFGMVRTVVTAELFSIPFFITLAFTRSLGLAVIAFWFRGALMNMNHPVTANFIMEAVDPRDREFTNAGKELSWSSSWMLSTQVGGWLIEAHGFAVPILVTVLLYLTSSSLFWFFFHDHERTQRLTAAGAAAGDLKGLSPDDALPR